MLQDGLLSYTMRELANMPDDNPKWILLDGDLDANWVESMNSVMDDSRLLTLPSNERIRLLPHMKMIFEIRDLKYATPVRLLAVPSEGSTAGCRQYCCLYHRAGNHATRSLVSCSTCQIKLPLCFLYSCVRRLLPHVQASCTSVRDGNGTTWCRAGCRGLPSPMLRRPSGR